MLVVYMLAQVSLLLAAASLTLRHFPCAFNRLCSPLFVGPQGNCLGCVVVQLRTAARCWVCVCTRHCTGCVGHLPVVISLGGASL